MTVGRSILLCNLFLIFMVSNEDTIFLLQCCCWNFILNVHFGLQRVVWPSIHCLRVVLQLVYKNLDFNVRYISRSWPTIVVTPLWSSMYFLIYSSHWNSSWYGKFSVFIQSIQWQERLTVLCWLGTVHHTVGFSSCN